MGNDFLDKRGNYRELRCFQLAEHLYDIPFIFCERFIGRGDRTKDQMVQAARSIKQNIAEGSSAAAMSTQTEMFLTNVGKSSQQELLLDYEDYLITRGLAKWGLEDPRLKNVRAALRQRMTREFMIEKAKGWSDETIANVAITLVHQCDRMLTGLLEYQKQQFLQKGGIKEQMAKARMEVRETQRTQSSHRIAPDCPICGKPMIMRMPRQGNQPGREFWGCSDYPRCKGTRQIDDSINK
ncbi:MAG: four helix bundle suffix domain-containing protein [Muribaculaceae bacterium]|nr:four helix bundle suffix domain-containing protein [Muribaculaceae bacterium]